MENKKVKLELLEGTPFVKNGKFEKEKAIIYMGKIAGECYSTDGWSKLSKESEENTNTRINRTLSMEHSTPYEHVNITFEITNMSKMLAMILNNERQCATSEKSARYTDISKLISNEENVLYEKWIDIFATKIKATYKEYKRFDDVTVKKLAQENARYLASVFTPMQMIHTIPWIQLNRVVSFMKDYIENSGNTYFEKKLSEDFNGFILECERLNLLDERAMSNRKNRGLSLFCSKKIKENFAQTYSVNYLGTFAQLAQAHRHRTLKYNMMLLKDKKYFVPPILKDDENLVKEWLNDMNKVAHLIPQGELVLINEMGTIDDLILKAKERLCTAAQLEVEMQTKETIDKALKFYKENDKGLYEDFLPYTKGARCTFPQYECAKSCEFKEGITLTRKI